MADSTTAFQNLADNPNAARALCSQIGTVRDLLRVKRERIRQAIELLDYAADVAGEIADDDFDGHEGLASDATSDLATTISRALEAIESVKLTRSDKDLIARNLSPA